MCHWLGLPLHFCQFLKCRHLFAEAVYETTACSDGIIEKRPQLEGYNQITKISDINVAECLNRCAQYNLDNEVADDEKCDFVSHEHLERISDENGTPVPTDDLKRRVTDLSLCVLFKVPSTSGFSTKQETFDKYYDPVTDPWRVGRWDSYLIPKCHPKISWFTVLFPSTCMSVICMYV